MKVKEVAKLAGISVRTLHHYDEIGLLVPDQVSEAGYRIYSEQNLKTLQQILFFRELDFPLKEIKEILHAPDFDRIETLKKHRKHLVEQRQRYDRMIATLDKSIQQEKGEITMTKEEMFDGFDFRHNPYEQEARERWGDEAVEESQRKLGNMSKGEQEALGEKMNAMFRKLATYKEMDPASDEAQAAIKQWYDMLNQMGTYSLEAFKALGQMYVDDERFTQNIDRFGEGLAQFMRDAMAIYADRAKTE